VTAPLPLRASVPKLVSRAASVSPAVGSAGTTSTVGLPISYFIVVGVPLATMWQW
jgi:hypothetical protein